MLLLPPMLPLQGSHAVPGQLLLLNTTEAFNRLDKTAAIKQVGRIWALLVLLEASHDRQVDICSGQHQQVAAVVIFLLFCLQPRSNPGSCLLSSACLKAAQHNTSSTCATVHAQSHTRLVCQSPLFSVLTVSGFRCMML